MNFARLLGDVTPDAVLLASDFDGTLAPITDQPDRAEALPAALRALHLLAPKLGSLSVHFRDVPEAGPELERRVRELATAHGLRTRGGRMVVEVTPERADKARALREQIEVLLPRAVLFAGDDTGDRGCFALVASLPVTHLAVGVRSAEADPTLFERCDLVVDGPEAWAALLTELAEWALAS